MIIKNPTIIIKGSAEALGGEYNIEQIVDGDDCELLVTTATGASKPKLQEKTANPTTTTQTIMPDENYDGLSSVEILAVDNSIDENIKAENIKKDIIILGVTGILESGGGEEPEPVTTSPALFTIEGSTITAYIGTETDVIIPVSYSLTYTEGTTEGLLISSSQYYSLSNLYDMISMTFTDGSKTMTFSSFDTLESDLSSNFPNNCYLIYAQASDPYAFYFLQDFYDITEITIWGKVFNSNMDAIEHIMDLNMTTVCFIGAYLEKANIPGKDINITEISYDGRTYQFFKIVKFLKN